ARSQPHDVGRRQNQRTVRLQHAVELAQKRESILEVLDALDRQGHVVRRVGKGKPAVEVGVVIRGAKEAGAGGVDIDAARVVSGVLQRGRQQAIAARGVENDTLL